MSSTHSLITKIKDKIKYEIEHRWTHHIFYKKRIGTGLSKEVCKTERKKYLNLFEANEWKMPLRKQMHAFFTTRIKLVYDNLILSDNPKDPVLIVVEKNDLERMKVFMAHYKKIGVRQFIVVDNNSDDGTLEWLSTQENVRVYSIKDTYETHKRVAWIQRVLAMTGYDRWYLVMDSDELLDYVGSETHNIIDCVEWAEEHRYDRLCGLMLDMYPDAPMFSIKNSDIENTVWYFDGSDSYRKEYRDTENGTVTRTILLGGARERVLGSTTKLGKQPLFYFTKEALYYNSHFFIPIVEYDEAPCCFAIRHYKFLDTDAIEYKKRVINGNYGFGSKYYKDMFDKSGNHKADNMIYEGSVKHESSESFRNIALIDRLWN